MEQLATYDKATSVVWSTHTDEMRLLYTVTGANAPFSTYKFITLKLIAL
jgi:hypothetical protein